MQLSFITRGNSSPNGKPRIWLLCHPDDMPKYFDEITQDIFATQNCSIWYTNEKQIPADSAKFESAQMQLLVIVVTKRMLTEENDALNVVYPFALENQIPVLPILVEHGLDHLFSKSIGALQYLDKTAIDPTAIPYRERLAGYLNSVLLNDEQIDQIRDAFDAYVFLSYRKKDRAFAQELMRLIHNNDFCERVAIWYDEFLTPGEDFNQSIESALKKSSLFALVVTPNIVNEKNYIMEVEYPMAQKEAKAMLPVEMAETQTELLSEYYHGIPEPVNGHDPEKLRNVLRDHLSAAVRTDRNDPVHDYFVGLAYLSGIDVEVDLNRAFRLISSAANAGLDLAMKRLGHMYWNGQGVQTDRQMAIQWLDRFLEQLSTDLEKSMTEENAFRLLAEMMEFGDMTYDAGDYANAERAFSTAYDLARCLSIGAVSKTVLGKLKVWFNKIIMRRSPYWEDSIKATSRCCAKMFDISIKSGHGQEAVKWSKIAIPLIQTINTIYLDDKTAADIFTLFGRLITYNTGNGHYSGALQCFEIITKCMSTLNDMYKTPDVKYRYALVGDAMIFYDLSTEDFGDAMQCIIWKKEKLKELSEEFPDSPQFRYDIVKSLLTEANIQTLISEYDKAAACLEQAKQMLAQEEEQDADTQTQILTVLYALRKVELETLTNARSEADVQSRIEAAETLKKGYERLSAIRNGIFDVDYEILTANICESLGDIYMDTERFQEADTWYRQAEEILFAVVKSSNSLYQYRLLARVYEKILNVSIALQDSLAIGEWYEKTLFAFDKIAYKVKFQNKKIESVRNEKDIAAAEKMKSRRQEIRDYIEKYRSDENTVGEYLHKAEVSTEDIEREMVPIIETYWKSHISKSIDDHLIRLLSYLSNKGKPDKSKEETIPFYALHCIQSELLKNIKPYLKYKEEAMLILAFCGYYTLLKAKSTAELREECLEDYLVFFRGIVFWRYKTTDVKYLELWNLMYNWVENKK